MTMPALLQNRDELMERIARDLVDSYDEEFELEIEDREIDETGLSRAPDKAARQAYFRELFRLQGELVKLQDWVQHSRQKVVILFEGRDAAGKGGVIKRITQRLNPRVARVAALPAPNDRERTQWYFQRYVQHLPAAGEMVLFDRSWYNRAGVERVMGFCSEGEGNHARAHPHPRGAVVGGAGGRQEEGAAQLHHAPAGATALPRSGARARGAAAARAQRRLPAPAGASGNVRTRGVLKVFK
jgi:hypothetical protein